VPFLKLAKPLTPGPSSYPRAESKFLSVNDLSDAATALRDALKDPQVDKTKIEPLIQKLDDTFGQFQKVEGDLWKRVQQ